MTGAEFDAIFRRALVTEVVDAVVQRLGRLRRQVAVLWTGTRFGLEEAIGGLGELRSRGWNFTNFCSEGGRRSGVADAVARAGFEIADPSGADLSVSRYSMLVVPTLTVSCAAKFATCMRDSFPSWLMATALERGIDIIAARDGCCPDSLPRLRAGLRPPAAMRERMRANLCELVAFGVTLVGAGRIAGTVEGRDRLRWERPRFEPPRHEVAADFHAKRVFSQVDAMQFDNTDLRLADGVLVTPLAREELRRRNVIVVRE